MLLCIFMLFAGEKPAEQVSNPLKPGPYSYQFVETFRFGAENDDDNYYWTDGEISANFDIDNRGHIFIVDGKDNRILEFDDAGKLIRQIAIEGEGPGEYKNLFHFQILADGTAIGFDFLRATAKFNYYDTSINYKQTVLTHSGDFRFYHPSFSPNGKWIYSSGFQVEDKTGVTWYKTALFDADRKLKLSLSQDEWASFEPDRIMDPMFWETYLAKQFHGIVSRGSAFVRFLSDNSVLLIRDGKKYELEQWDSEFTHKKRHISKEYKPIPYSEEDSNTMVIAVKEAIFEALPNVKEVVTENVIRRAIDKADLPKVWNPILDVLPDDRGGFLVIYRRVASEGTFKADLFDHAGVCIGRTESPNKGIIDIFGVRAKFKKGNLYAMVKNEVGDNQFVRYTSKLVKK